MIKNTEKIHTTSTSFKKQHDIFVDMWDMIIQPVVLLLFKHRGIDNIENTENMESRNALSPYACAAKCASAWRRSAKVLIHVATD